MTNVTTSNRFAFTALAVALILVLIMLFRGCMGCESTGSDSPPVPARPVAPAATTALVEFIHDTVVRWRERITIREAPARVVAYRDTVVQWRDTSGAMTEGTPFTATADTVIGRDTITMRVDHPPPRLSLMLRSAPDTAITTTPVITITVREAAPWWHYVLTTIGGTALGYGLGRIP